ncbi:Monooxygenase FAD-binding [Penicillium cf. griseofulvum]|uniref:Monooxygenase FAD-binding n=1 Tax=Penicillium cf. griseofulvum TaxID=2972120 RepID=A0A9W9J207_9EURO|nr:Monooxygenase FAD-binding [Penicillium cf. griseofulvum]KAJ5433916.1 Monooxygenase FAD-binding [Penicillium cf. griseofulvum]
MASNLPHTHGDHAPFNVAIVGGGIVGLHVALGLTKRGIPVTIYEQAHELKGIGAGMGFMSNIVGCMAAIDPKIAESLDDISVRSASKMRWIDGLAREDLRSRPKERLFDVALGFDEEATTRATHRGYFLTELVKLLPSNQIKLGKRLDTIVQSGENEKLLFKFCDTTTAETDAVIGCDGIKSCVRRLVLDDDDPAAVPHYAHETAYRCLVDMDKVLPVMGDLCKTMVIEKHTVSGSKKNIQQAYSGFGPTVQSLAALLPDELNCWAMFDTFDHPLPTYSYGRITLAGDAAHGSTPHYGSGAGMGVEDALVLSTVLQQAATKIRTHDVAVSKARVLSAAFEAYDAVRRERSQWLVRCSRRQGQKVKGLDQEIGKDFDKFKEHTKANMDEIYYYDFRAMLQQATDEFEHRLSGSIRV